MIESVCSYDSTISNMGNEERNKMYQERTAYGSDTVTTDWIITNYGRIHKFRGAYLLFTPALSEIFAGSNERQNDCGQIGLRRS
jgi:hypothetical protein